MPIVAMPDGAQVQFPDDMPKEQIRSLILQKFPDVASPKKDDNGLAERQKLSPVEKALSPITSYPETYQKMNKEARDQVSRGAEQFTSGSGALEVAKGAGNVALGTLGFVASPINAAYRSVIGQPVEDVTGIPREYTELAAQLATPGIGFTGRAPALSVAPAKTLSPGQEVVAAADRLSEVGSPVQVPRAVSSDKMAVQRAAAVTRNIPLAGDPLVKAAEKTIGQLGNKAGEVASGYGGGTVVGSGDAARESIKHYITGKSAETSSKLYKKVDELVDNTVLTPLSNTADTAGKIAARRANAGISEVSSVVKKIAEAIARPGLNYEGVKDLRGYIRELKDNPSMLPADLSGKELNSIYQSLTADLKASVANAGGSKASVAFERANKHYALLSERRESLAKIIGTNADAPAEKVFDRLVNMASSKSNADIAKLVQARKAMGSDDWNEFASGVVGKMGRDTASFSGPERLLADGFSPQRFMTAYGNLSPAGKSVLFRSGGNTDLANHLDDIARVSGRFKELLKFANPSGTGQAAIGGGIGAGLIADPLTTISSVIGGRVLATALARPAGAASIAKLAKTQQLLVTNPTPSKLVAYSLAARNLISTLELKAVTPADFLKSLQGPVPARAQDEQP